MLIPASKKGDPLLPLLFSLYINDLTKDVNNEHDGVICSNNECILLYADDIVLLSDSSDKASAILNYLNKWCMRWQIYQCNQMEKHTLPKSQTPGNIILI